MAKSTCGFGTNGGVTPEQMLDQISAALQPTEADKLWAGNVIKSGILERTARGVDYKGQPFAPYNDSRPFYYYPGSAMGNLLRKRGRGDDAKVYEDWSHGRNDVRRSVKRLHKKLGGAGAITKGGTGIRFESYAAFKTSLGRAGVDLRGPHAPHMLQAIVVKIDGGEAVVGIYDDFAAAKASGHNDGLHRHLPQRQFMEASEEDVQLIIRDLEPRLLGRARKLLRA